MSVGQKKFIPPKRRNPAGTSAWPMAARNGSIISGSEKFWRALQMPCNASCYRETKSKKPTALGVYFHRVDNCALHCRHHYRIFLTCIDSSSRFEIEDKLYK